MNDRRLFAGNFALAGFAAAAALATALLFGGIEVLADHYANAHNGAQAAATTTVQPNAS